MIVSNDMENQYHTGSVFGAQLLHHERRGSSLDRKRHTTAHASLHEPRKLTGAAYAKFSAILDYRGGLPWSAILKVVSLVSRLLDREALFDFSHMLRDVTHTF